MQMIKVAEGSYVVPSAVGAVESQCERFDGTGTMVCRTTIRSISGDVLFAREDCAKLNDSTGCESMQAAHRGYVSNLING